ncbi:response regulator transcription factor [Anoxybacillus eryuanensis]|uniref:response regulator transcription factor n=1 Tax=Anoxybacillus eryuanensis TaxID=651866 RepID=UPI003EF46B3E
MIHILVADDDIHVRELLKLYLSREGYVVHEAADGEEALMVLNHQTIHLAIIDIMMPNKDGYQLCEEIRKHYDLPVILLTAKDQLVDKEKGYMAGTDDYVTKPFEPKELLFRIKALLRRYQMVSEHIIQVKGTTINRKSYEIYSDGKVYMLPLKEFELFAQLASYPGRTFSREELIQLIWGIDFQGDERTIDVHIKRIRERFADSDDFVIQTVRGVGYRLHIK